MGSDMMKRMSYAEFLKELKERIQKGSIHHTPFHLPCVFTSFTATSSLHLHIHPKPLFDYKTYIL